MKIFKYLPFILYEIISHWINRDGRIIRINLCLYPVIWLMAEYQMFILHVIEIKEFRNHLSFISYYFSAIDTIYGWKLLTLYHRSEWRLDQSSLLSPQWSSTDWPSITYLGTWKSRIMSLCFSCIKPLHWNIFNKKFNYRISNIVTNY